MTNQLENFDQLLKDAVDGAEVPFNDAHWNELEEELNVVSPSVTGYFSSISTGIVATSVVFAAMLFLFSDGNSHEKVIAEQVKTESNELNGGLNNSSNSMQSQIATTNSDSSIDVSSFENNQDSSTPSENENAELEMGKSNLSTSESSTQNQLAESNIENTNSRHNDSNKNQKSTENNKVVASTTELTEEKTNVRKGCTGLTIAFDASEEYGAKAKYLWNFGDGYFSNEANPSHTFNKEGVFDVSLSVTSAVSGQITSNVVQAMIEIEEAPIANLDLLISDANTITFNNKSYNSNDVEWNLDGVTYGNGSSISVSVADNTNYELQLSAINEGGCADTLMTKIRSIKAGSEFPRAIDTSYGTPFAPGAILDEGEVTSVKIYNIKSEDLVFEGSGNKGWNGYLTSGSKAEKGNYKWIMTVVKENSVDVYQGKLELR